MAKKLNVGVVKCGANLTQSKSIQTASNFDVFSLLPIIAEAGHTVRVFTKITRNTIIKKPYMLHDLMKVQSFDKLDVLLIFGGPVQFFGGVEDKGFMHLYTLLNKFKGRVYMVMTDSRYPLMQLWDYITIKDWHTKYERDDLYVTRDDIHYLYQGRDTSKLFEMCERRTRFVNIKEENIHPFPIDWAIMLDPPEPKLRPLDERVYQLAYGGSNRDANRKNRFKHYYFDNGLETNIFGSIKIEGDNNKIGTVAHKLFVNQMSKSIATVIICDKFYKDNFFTLRMYESIIAGCITFIDDELDTQHLFYKDDEMLIDLLYVHSVDEMKVKLDRILELGQDFFANIQRRQLVCIQNMYSENEYKHMLLDIIEN